MCQKAPQWLCEKVLQSVHTSRQSVMVARNTPWWYGIQDRVSFKIVSFLKIEISTTVIKNSVTHFYQQIFIFIVLFLE